MTCAVVCALAYLQASPAGGAQPATPLAGPSAAATGALGQSVLPPTHTLEIALYTLSAATETDVEGLTADLITALNNRGLTNVEPSGVKFFATWNVFKSKEYYYVVWVRETDERTARKVRMSLWVWRTGPELAQEGKQKVAKDFLPCNVDEEEEWQFCRKTTMNDVVNVLVGLDRADGKVN
ncbi:MAG TPA: hypothetical protein VL523_13290 [Terriglobia bacterium]|nr:hypothetical protein [Terriglobia bacterium]